jgi:hypothetical protein
MNDLFAIAKFQHTRHVCYCEVPTHLTCLLFVGLCFQSVYSVCNFMIPATRQKKYEQYGFNHVLVQERYTQCSVLIRTTFPARWLKIEQGFTKVSKQ